MAANWFEEKDFPHRRRKRFYSPTKDIKCPLHNFTSDVIRFEHKADYIRTQHGIEWAESPSSPFFLNCFERKAKNFSSLNLSDVLSIVNKRRWILVKLLIKEARKFRSLWKGKLGKLSRIENRKEKFLLPDMSQASLENFPIGSSSTGWANFFPSPARKLSKYWSLL